MPPDTHHADWPKDIEARRGYTADAEGFVSEVLDAYDAFCARMQDNITAFAGESSSHKSVFAHPLSLVRPKFDGGFPFHDFVQYYADDILDVDGSNITIARTFVSDVRAQVRLEAGTSCIPLPSKQSFFEWAMKQCGTDEVQHYGCYLIVEYMV